MIRSRHKSERQPPQRLSREQVQAAVSHAQGALTPPDARWVGRAVATLRAIRSGAVERYAEVDGVRLLEKVTHDYEVDCAYYHLTARARELLRANSGLPWGRN